MTLIRWTILEPNEVRFQLNAQPRPVFGSIRHAAGPRPVIRFNGGGSIAIDVMQAFLAAIELKAWMRGAVSRVEKIGAYFNIEGSD